MPPELQARIADFVGPRDRASMRMMSRVNQVIYGARPERAYNIRQRLTMIDLQTGQERVYRTPNSILTVNPFSLEIGTTEQVENVLDLVNVPTKDQLTGEFLGGWFQDFIGQDFNGVAFRQLTDFLEMDAGAEGAVEPHYANFRLEWPYINFILTDRMFRKAFLLEDAEGFYFNFSLFSALQLQNLIRESTQFPITFVKVREINLLDHAFLRGPLEVPPETPLAPLVRVRTIDDFVAFQRTRFLPGEHFLLGDDQGLRTLLTRFLGGDGATTLEGLRQQARYRYVHEINVDKFLDQPLSFPLRPEENESMEEEGASASAFRASDGGGSSAGASSGGGSSGGGKRKRGQ